MKVLIVDPDISYPPTSGKRLRTLNLLLPLARRHQLTYLARGNGHADEDQVAVEYLKDHSIEPIIATAPLPPKGGVGLYWRLIANLFSPLPYSAAIQALPRLRAAVGAYLATHSPDVIQVEWVGNLHAVQGQQARKARPAPVVLQAHNVETLLWQRYHDAEPSWARRLYIRRQWKKFERFERRMFHAVERVIAVSGDDAALANRLFGCDRIDVVDNGVDAAAFREVRPEPGSRRILYLGALDWRPNLDAVKLLLGSIFPAVRARVPDVTLVLVGRHPPPWLREQAAASPGVELHADVPDVRPYMAGCSVMAVPLRIGGGSRLKILEALAAGLPVVSSRVGAEGLSLRPGVDYVQADTADEAAAALTEAITHPGPCLARAEKARELVAASYDWAVLADRLERCWEKAVRGRHGAAGAHPQEEEAQPCTSSS